MSSYKIKDLQRKKAKELGVEIKTSTNPNKKVDVFVADKKVASIGAGKGKDGKPLKDYATYLKEDKKLAEKRRENYIKRHSKEPKVNDDGTFSKSFYSDEILWGKPKKAVNDEISGFQKFVKKVKKEQEAKRERKLARMSKADREKEEKKKKSKPQKKK